mgnify:CR=1 FL=1
MGITEYEINEMLLKSRDEVLFALVALHPEIWEKEKLRLLLIQMRQSWINSK